MMIKNLVVLLILIAIGGCAQSTPNVQPSIADKRLIESLTKIEIGVASPPTELDVNGQEYCFKILLQESQAQRSVQ